MKIILLNDVKGIGKKYEVKEVAAGHAVNFLIPRKMAEAATPAKIQEIENHKIRQEKALKEDLKERRELADKIKGFDLTIPIKMGEKGKTFGSVSAARITGELEKKGLAVGKGKIILEKSIKDTGEHKVTVDFGGGIQTEIKVKIVAEN